MVNPEVSDSGGLGTPPDVSFRPGAPATHSLGSPAFFLPLRTSRGGRGTKPLAGPDFSPSLVRAPREENGLAAAGRPTRYFSYYYYCCYYYCYYYYYYYYYDYYFYYYYYYYFYYYYYYYS